MLFFVLQTLRKSSYYMLVGGWRLIMFVLFQLIDAVGGVRHAVTGGEPVDDHMGAFPPPPDMNQLHISGKSLLHVNHKIM